MTSDTAITTARLQLRLVVEEDADHIFEYCRNPDVARYTSWEAHRTIDDARQYVAFVQRSHSDRPGTLRHVWAIRQRNSAQVIGTVDLIQRADDTAYTDFALAQAFWGHGLTTEAVAAITQWGFARIAALRQIRSTCLLANAGSQRVLEKAGFRLVKRELAQLGEKFEFQRQEVSRYEKRRPDHPV